MYHQWGNPGQVPSPQHVPTTPSKNSMNYAMQQQSPARLSTPTNGMRVPNQNGNGQATPIRFANNGSQQARTPQQSRVNPQQNYTNGAAGGGGASAQQSKKKEEAPVEEDEVGHYQVSAGATIDRSEPFRNGRYTIVKLLGSGTYGKVVEAEDNKYNKTHVAIKLVRREPPLYRVSAKNEIAILRDLDGRCGNLKLLREFDHQGHVCMSFELLGDHLSDVLKQNGKPFKMESIRDVSFQLLQAIAYVHSKDIIHTDLKAENILLMSNPAGALSVKVADFGSAIYTSAWHPPLVGTMHYRSPEAVVQAGWSYALDVWAIACLIIELCTGSHMFELAHDDVHLAMMQKLLGPLPQDLLRKGYANRNQYNTTLLQRTPDGNVRLSPMRPDGHAMVAKIRRLQDMIPDPVLVDLLKQMLLYDPNTRVSAQTALMHPFFDLDDASSDIDSLQASPDVTPQAPHHHHIAHPPPMQYEREDRVQHAHGTRGATRGLAPPVPPRELNHHHHQPAPPSPSVTDSTLDQQGAAAAVLTPHLLQRAGLAQTAQSERHSSLDSNAYHTPFRNGAAPDDVPFELRLAAAEERLSAYGLLSEGEHVEDARVGGGGTGGGEGPSLDARGGGGGGGGGWSNTDRLSTMPPLPSDGARGANDDGKDGEAITRAIHDLNAIQDLLRENSTRRKRG